METVAATLSIEMHVECPNKECGNYIDILNQSETGGVDHNDDGFLLRQMFPRHGSHDDFEIEDIICQRCKTKFDVKTLEW